MSVAAKTLAGALATIVLWQVAVWLFSPPHFILPPPLDVVRAFGTQPGFLLTQFFTTLKEVLAGLALGILLGIATALLVAALPRVGALVWPLALVLQALPVFALAPVLVLWFGYGLASKIIMAAIVIFFPVASAFLDGLSRTDQSILDAAALTGASRWQTLRYIRVPLALPSLIAGLRIAAAFAPLGAVVGEWVGASGGLGFVMLQANARMQTATMFAALALIAALTLVLRVTADRLTRGLVHWAPET
jgi:putative hydroxymethylpyrimidine transport system permease protein